MVESDATLKALMKRIAVKDKQAFASLYRAMEKPLFRFVNVEIERSVPVGRHTP